MGFASHARNPPPMLLRLPDPQSEIRNRATRTAPYGVNRGPEMLQGSGVEMESALPDWRRDTPTQACFALFVA